MPTGERSWRLNHSEDEPCKEHGKQRMRMVRFKCLIDRKAEPSLVSLSELQMRSHTGRAPPSPLPD
jgi:hypothetical protein